MSVFKRAGSEVYSYDFRCRGRRFSGTTDCTTKRAAEAFERQVKDEAKRDQLDTSKPLTFQAAAFIYWNEVGQHHSDPSGPERNIAWLQAEIGANTLLSDITNAIVARLVAKRRGEDVANATVNRSVVEPLRTILRRAAKMNGAKIQSIDWSAHRLKEPEERVREANTNEQAAVLAAMREDYRPLITFAIMTGCRRGEIVGLTWQDVNWFAREFRVKGKGDYSRTIPMTDALHELLFSLKDHHKTAVFTFVAARTRDGRTKGKRYPVTDEGFNTFWQRYGKKAVTDFRFHDTRHTAATRLVRRTGNLKMVQRLLGHKNIETTARYAHVTHDDLRDGLEAVDAATNATKNATKKRKRSSKDMI